MFKNTHQKYGLISKLFHWLSAMVIYVLFGLGFWMVDLDYYSEWYQKAPHWHESIGILLCLFTLFRLLNRCLQKPVGKLNNLSKLQQQAASIVHLLLYALLFIIFISGYLIPTSDGTTIQIFTWFSIPSLGQLFSDQSDIAGNIHEYGAYLLIGLSLLHLLAALKHHFIDKDDSLMRIIK